MLYLAESALEASQAEVARLQAELILKDKYIAALRLLWQH
jgi:hypothetical protein